ncbi:hypothetical protein BJX68DRAFT_275511 [Aspergillus pseudodeflectus]|uniref:Polyketide synthase n=1 Tax=Aspergillus pseudodeflectus TaxID=176178 RepID=A0ABR4L6A1_9EURO
MPSSIPPLIICGSQTIPPTAEILDQLASYLTRRQNTPELGPLVEAIRALPEAWATLKTAEPRLQALSDAPVLSLGHWLSATSSSSLHSDFTSSSDSTLDGRTNTYSRLAIPATLPNVLLAPLTVIIHIAQYSHYLDGLNLDLGLSGASPDPDAHVYIREGFAAACPVHPPETGIGTASQFQGLCIGMLSAAVMESSATRTELGKNAAAAVRLAVCIGGYIDSKRALAMTGSKSNPSLNSDSDVVCFIARWGMVSGREIVEAILSRYPEAYISVELDRNSVTITAPDCDSRFLRGELNSHGVRVADIPVRGRYHSSKNESLVRSLLELCSTDSASPFWVPWGVEKLECCLRSILTEQAGWFSEMSKTVSSLSHMSPMPMTFLELGLVSSFPPSLSVLPHLRIVRGSLSLPAPRAQDRDQDQDAYNYPETSVAIIGAACKYPGAGSLDQLWTLISTAQVMFSEAPAGRFKESVAGNFISDVDQFDYGLFGISPREATYMDPQQRIALQVAYQAVESSGYFASPDPELDVGCYVGVGSSDYEHNVNQNSPTAYSFTGTSRAFVSGRVSHFFKWTGPSLTVDTACSSSATAIHQACNGLAMGDCSLALAGGVHIMASLPADRNIAAAGMTNSSGPCRPFDADAAGYSRGEGCGFLVLKRLSAALASGDHILGVIAATATNQSNGSSSITVPVSQSQSDAYRRALSRAAMSPADISYVEAHGTGTQRGDPVEYQSIREVFGGEGKVHIGSLKANIGHTEGASGVAGVLKVLLMLRHGQIPAQANFARLNPAIPAQEREDRLVVPTRLQKWDRKFRAACVNNYGAAGSNAAIIICQPPCDHRMVQGELSGPVEPSRYPFLISGQSPVSIQRYCAALAQYVEAKSPSLAEVASLVARQQNRSLRHRRVFHAASIPELQDHLRHHAQTDDTVLSLSGRQSKPIVLVFGGQSGSILHFSKAVYDASYHVRQHVDKCHALIRQMGLPGLFPDIFSQCPIDDLVILHCCLFSIQYSCAAAWLEAGLSVHRVIGHSFGQLTAMCISGVVTLEDALRLVVGRAQLIRDCWGDEKGCMLSVEIDREGAEALARSEPGIEVACYNGPSNHVLVGSQSAIANVERRALSSSLRTRRLKTTHGFHSHLIDPIMPRYLDLVKTVTFRAPVIAIEACSETSAWGSFTAQLVAEHSRGPVYFCDAVQRIEGDLGQCIWLEAGSASGAVMLVKQSLISDSNSLCGLHLGSSNQRNPLDSVVNATLELWTQGSSAQCWIYHPKTPIYSSRLVGLPGYQFDTSLHWLSCVEPEVERKVSSLERTPSGLVSLASLSHPGPGVFSFEVNQGDQTLAHILAGRKVLGGSLWPLALYMEVAAQATALLTPSLPPASQIIRLFGLKIKTPIGAGQIDGLRLRLEQSNMRAWEFSLESDATEHALGTVMLDDQHTSTEQILNYKDPDFYSLEKATAPSISSASGMIAYKLLEKVTEYEPSHRGIECIRMNEHAAMARVHLPKAAKAAGYAGKTRCNPILIDQFLAVAEIHALTMEDCKRDEVFACSGLGEATILASFAGAAAGRARSWSVYVRQSSKQGREIIYDIFVSDAGVDLGHDQNQDQGDQGMDPCLVLALVGVKFLRTSTHALEQIVARANLTSAPASPEKVGTPLQMQEEEVGTATIWPVIASLLHELTGCPPERISPRTALADLGMDSLSIMEFKARIGAIFNVHLPGIVEANPTVELICDAITVAQTTLAPTRFSRSQFTLTPSGSGSGSSETQASEVSLSTSTSTSTSTMLANIAKTVSAHLKTGEKLSSSSQLHSLGLDSLATLELQSDLQRSFGLRVSLMQLDGSATISDLHAMLVRRGVK